MNPENKPQTQPQSRQQKIEAFLLDPEKTIFQSLEEFQAAAEQLLQIFEGVDIASLEQLVGEDGKTPVRGEDYFTEEDIRAIEDFIISKIPVVGKDLPSVAQVLAYIQREVAKIPRVKGDKGDRGANGRDGRDGSPDTPEQIIAKLRTLPKNKRFTISDVRGLENILRDYRDALEQIPELQKALEDLRVVIPANTSSEGGGSGLTQEQVEDVVAAMFGGAHTGITVTYDDGAGTLTLEVTASGAGEANTASNIGTAGVGIFKDKSGADLRFKKLNAGSAKVTITDDTGNNEVDIDVDEAEFDVDDMVEGSTNKFATAAEKTKLGHISVTQAVDLDAIETRVNALDAAVVLKGTWDASSGSFPGSGSAQAGESWIVSVGGTVDGQVFVANDRIVAIVDNASTSTYAANWHKLDYTDAVLSVAGKTGAVTLDANDVAEVTDKRYMTDAQETKLDSVESNADVTDATNVGSSIHGATAKTTPVDADTMPLIDSAASNVLKKVTWANIKATLAVAVQTLTGKRIQPRVYSTTSTATLTPEIDTYDVFTLTAQAAALTIANHSTSTPTDGEQMRIRVKDNATARAISFGSNYSAAGGIALPTTTTISKQMTMGFEWYASLSKWVLVALAEEA